MLVKLTYVDFLKENGIVDSQGNKSSVCRFYTCYDCGLSSIIKGNAKRCNHCRSNHLKEWISDYKSLLLRE